MHSSMSAAGGNQASRPGRTAQAPPADPTATPAGAGCAAAARAAEQSRRSAVDRRCPSDSPLVARGSARRYWCFSGTHCRRDHAGELRAGAARRRRLDPRVSRHRVARHQHSGRGNPTRARRPPRPRTSMTPDSRLDANKRTVEAFYEVAVNKGRRSCVHTNRPAVRRAQPAHRRRHRRPKRLHRLRTGDIPKAAGGDQEHLRRGGIRDYACPQGCECPDSEAPRWWTSSSLSTDGSSSTGT